MKVVCSKHSCTKHVSCKAFRSVLTQITENLTLKLQSSKNNDASVKFTDSYKKAFITIAAPCKLRV